MKSSNPFHKRVLRGLQNYAGNVRAFSRNASLYLLSTIISSSAFGVFRLLFNFYVLSLGYDEALVGNLVAASSMTALIAAIPMGYLADLLGRKVSLIGGGLVTVIAISGMLLFPSPTMFILMNVLMGLGQSISGVTMGPFLMENSGEKERTYLFSFSSGISMAASSVGNWIGGLLPTWLAASAGGDATSAGAYRLSLAIVAAAASVAVIPLFMMAIKRGKAGERSLFAPFTYFKSHPSLLGKLILPMLVTSIGAGLIMPFMNLFFRQVHGQSDSAIGTLFAFGSLAMGIGLLIAPPLAEKYGKIQFVVITQALSIPFLALLGFSPLYWIAASAYYIRVALMNMSGPVYQTFVMEKVEPSARATVASLVSMANSFGWAFSPTISGYIQVKYGFGPAFFLTIILYVLSITLYWGFFWRGSRNKGIPDTVRH
ncbi:MAG TPA: MFS transporter [Anaerolineaceae bacterium]|nr:MFS transporter [Anaerolineaceae bacterium]